MFHNEAFFTTQNYDNIISTRLYISRKGLPKIKTRIRYDYCRLSQAWSSFFIFYWMLEKTICEISAISASVRVISYPEFSIKTAIAYLWPLGRWT